MYQFSLIEYIYWNFRYNLKILTANRRDISGMHAAQFNLLDVAVANF